MIRLIDDTLLDEVSAEARQSPELSGSVPNAWATSRHLRCVQEQSRRIRSHFERDPVRYAA
jgi:hypothetical protein